MIVGIRWFIASHKRNERRLQYREEHADWRDVPEVVVLPAEDTVLGDGRLDPVHEAVRSMGGEA